MSSPGELIRDSATNAHGGILYHLFGWLAGRHSQMLEAATQAIFWSLIRMGHLT
jgi:hypothetical protein